MKIANEEIFGPLLSVRSYGTLDETIYYINRHPKPLAAYYFGPSDANRKRFIERTYSGGVTINDVILHHAVEDMPFGGVGPVVWAITMAVMGLRLSAMQKALSQHRCDSIHCNWFRHPMGHA